MVKRISNYGVIINVYTHTHVAPGNFLLEFLQEITEVVFSRLPLVFGRYIFIRYHATGWI